MLVLRPLPCLTPVLGSKEGLRQFPSSALQSSLFEPPLSQRNSSEHWDDRNLSGTLLAEMPRKEILLTRETNSTAL